MIQIHFLQMDFYLLFYFQIMTFYYIVLMNPIVYLMIIILKNDKDIVNSSLYEFPKLISGTWGLNVTQGNVTNFHSVFKLVSSDGLEKHFLKINNFQNSDTNTSIILNPYTYTILNGYADIKIDDQLFESHLPLKIELNRINTIIISIINKVLMIFYLIILSMVY